MLLLSEPLVVSQGRLAGILLVQLNDRVHDLDLVAVFVFHHHHFTARTFGGSVDLALGGLV
jgi:hypothetical protein